MELGYLLKSWKLLYGCIEGILSADARYRYHLGNWS